MRYFIGLDGGGSGCRAQAELESGIRSAVLQGGPANVFSEPEGAVAEIRALLAQCCAAAHALCPEADRAPAAIVLGLAGASESGAERTLRAALPYPCISVLGDIDITVRGALQAQDGIVAALGTGSVLARQRSGAMLRLGGYGPTLGDEASGSWLGRRALSAALHVRDGLIAPGPLSADVWSRYGSVNEMLAFARDARPVDFAAMAPCILEHDAEGCPIAGSILDDACAYLHRSVRTLQDGDAYLPVSGTGGLGPALVERMRVRLAPDIICARPLGGPLDGALWHARFIDGSALLDGHRP